MQTLLMEKTVEQVPVKKERRYPRLENRLKELDELYRKEKKTEYLMEDDCIIHFLGGNGRHTYERIASFCKEHHIERVMDIGCADGHQSEVFLMDGIDYVGVTDHVSDFWNKDHFTYLVGRYPCALPTQKGDLGISALCLTWNCYLYEGEKTLTEQCEALQRDFEHCLLYLQSDRIEFVSQYFKTVEKLDANLYYFSNK